MRTICAADEYCQMLGSWVPKAALNYLAHTVNGASIRALARIHGCHASTILRQVRNYEARRDDLLVDHALQRLGSRIEEDDAATGSCNPESIMTALPIETDTEISLATMKLNREAKRVLRRLCENGAVMAVAEEMDKAVVVRETEFGSSRTAVVDREVAEMMALNGWISCTTKGRISRYVITASGRSTLGQMMAEAESRAAMASDTYGEFLGEEYDDEISEEPKKRMRYGLAESPLILLARRRDRDGKRFLSEDLVRAGERLREDFEMAQLGEQTDQKVEDVLNEVLNTHSADDRSRAQVASRQRIADALHDLGPGLADIVIRCCCFLEGLENTEKKMGWSARSGKVVLRIALQRLKRYYDTLGDAAGLMG